MEKMDVQSPNFGPNPEGLTNGVPGGSGLTNGIFANGPHSSQSSFSSMLSAALENQKPPGWQLDLLMEKLRRKCNQLKPLPETSKNIRAAISERRYFMDQNDRLHLQKNLDSLQQSIKVNSLQSMVERLEMVSRQLGLKFTPGGNGNEWFISSDMFYLELLIDPSGVVQEVKIQHDGKTEQQNVPEMVECLRRNDFADFTAHLEGLVAIYQLNADKKIKSKAFIALQALEADLLAMASTYAHVTDGEAVIMKSLLGLLQPRKGGHPVKLVYFISPYELLDTVNKVTLSADSKTIAEKKLGSIANICIQASTSRKLQMSTTVTLGRAQDCKTFPRYGTLNATNSTALPACFTIQLGKPIPICKELLLTIQNITGISCFDFSEPHPILGLITRHVSNSTLDCSNNRGLFVALPDTPDTLQVHCYFMTETPSLEGMIVSSINFTLASQLPQIIALLRQQVIFNTLIGSCVRVGCKPEMNCIVFEVNALSRHNISVSFQHPLEDSLVTLEFDLRDVSHPMCRLHAVTNAADIIPTLEEHACKVVQRSLSIPVTVRAVIRRWQTMKSKYEPPPDYGIPVGGPYGSGSFNQANNEVSCGSESGKGSDQHGHNPQHSMVPGMVMGLNSNLNSTLNTYNMPQQSGQSMPYGHSGRHTSGSNNASYSISPLNTSNVNQSSSNMGFQSPATASTPTTPTSAADLMSSFMNPMFYGNQMGMTNNPQSFSMGGMNFQNFLDSKQNVSGFIDQGGQRARRRKRKGTSSDSNLNNSTSPGGSMNIQNNASVPRPSPSPSPKSPRAYGNTKSPKRRPSESSDMSDASQGENSRAPTPQTPLTPRGDSNAALSMLMSEMGMDVPDPRWNIDITPVGGPIGNSSASNSASGMDNFIASKLLSNLGSSLSGSASVGNEFSIENVDLDLDMEADGGLNRFSMPKKPGSKKNRDFPKRSISLDSHSSGNMDDIGANLQSLINSSGAPGSTEAATSMSSLVTPSLSITPVSTNSSMGQTTVNSLLAAIRPGIEIIPLPNPVQIPNSITVTPIQPKPTLTGADAAKKGSMMSKEKSKSDETTLSTIDGNGTTIKKKLSSSSLPGDTSISKKERKRKASSNIPPLLDETGMVVQDYAQIKQPKLSGPFTSSNASLFPSLEKKSSGSGMSVSLKGSPSPNFNLGMKKPGSPLQRATTPNKSPTPKIGGKPSVSTLKSVSSSPKYSDITSPSSNKPKSNKERKNSSSSFQGNAKIAKNLSLIGTPPGLPGLVPNLKALSDNPSMQLSLAGINPNFLGLAANSANAVKTTEASMAEAIMKANLLPKNLNDMSKASSASGTSLTQTVTGATSGSNQRPGGNSGSSGATAASSSNQGLGFGSKKGGLLAVIDKLKSQQNSGDESGKKEAGKVDHAKISSSITSDVMQLKKNQSTSSSSSGAGAGSTGNNQNLSGTFGGNNQEYIVKPTAGGGLKMKLGISSKSSISLKDKGKSGLKSLTGPKKVFVGPKSQNPAVQSPTNSSKNGNSGSSGFSASTPPSKKLSSNSGSKSAEKDTNFGEKLKSSKNNSASSSSNSSSTSSKGRPEDEMDLTRKLFMPGSGVFDAPKFDITKYQIPKKSNSSGPSSSNVKEGASSDSSPKNSATSSPQSKVLDRDVVTPTKDLEKLSSSNLSKSSLTAVEGKDQSKEKESSSTISSSETPSGGSSMLLSTNVTESKASSSAASEPTKIKLSSSAISENPYLQEMNKLFANSPSASVGSPKNMQLNSTSSSINRSKEYSSAQSEVVSSTTTSAREPEKSFTQSLKDFISPESPDPINNIQDDAIYKNTLTIPTTPLQPNPPVIIEDSANSGEPTSPNPPDDEDQLVIDTTDRKSAPVVNTSSEKSSPLGASGAEDTSLKKERLVMPPPPVPEQAAGISSTNTSTSTSASSPSGSAALSPAALPTATSPSPATATVPIVSVHIVHSPQPNSPALLRSPLVVQSPHSAHASPYAIDDDLMDEALIGTGK